MFAIATSLAKRAVAGCRNGSAPQSGGSWSCALITPHRPDFHALYVLRAAVGTASFAQARRAVRAADGWEEIVKTADGGVKESHTHQAKKKRPTFCPARMAS